MKKNCCGLMQKAKDIQLKRDFKMAQTVVVLMQKAKDIQQPVARCRAPDSCGLMQKAKDIQLYS